MTNRGRGKQQDCPSPSLPTSKRLAMLMPTLVGERQACGHCGGLIETAECRPTRLDVLGCLRRLARAARRWLVRPCSSIVVHADNSDEKLATR